MADVKLTEEEAEHVAGVLADCFELAANYGRSILARDAQVARDLIRDRIEGEEGQIGDNEQRQAAEAENPGGSA
jgi:hypothetical protein